MQIAVVDDASPTVDVAGLVRRLAGDRVEYYRNAANLRLAGNWNACIGHARGRWIHILHQDDLVLPGFYRRMAEAQNAGCGAAFCQHAFIDSGGRWLSISGLERESAGCLDGWLERIADRQVAQCPAVVVRRDTYERLGGFRPDLGFVLDWEMWVRIAASGASWWYEPSVLACYRTHCGSETARLREAGRDKLELARGIEIAREHLPPRLRRRAGLGLLADASGSNLLEAGNAIERGSLGEAIRLVHEACRMRTSLRISSPLMAYYRWILKAALRRAWRSRSTAVVPSRPQPSSPAP
jgi:glycosyltransferase involved in cell wall biosynthesis